MITLTFLTDDAVARDICHKYWAIDEDGEYLHRTVREIGQEYGITTRDISQLLGEHCQAVANDVCCPACQSPVIIRSRSHYAELHRYQAKNPKLCDDCAAEAEAQRRESATVELKRRQAILRLATERAPRITVDELTPKQAVCLEALVRHAASEDLSFIHAHVDIDSDRLAPGEMEIEILRVLFQQGVIVPDPDSRPNAFAWDEEGDGFSIYLTQVQYLIPFDSQRYSAISFADALRQRVLELPSVPEFQSEITPFINAVALNECLDYTVHCATEHQLTFSPGDKTRSVYSDLLKRFAVSQMFNFIWRASRDAAAFHLRQGTSRKHAGNVIPGSVQRSAERAEANGWAVKAFGRPYDRQQTAIERVLYNHLLGLDDAGFTLPPGELSQLFAPNQNMKNG